MAMLRYSPWLHIDHTKGAKILRECSTSYRSMDISQDVIPSMTLLVGRKAKSAMLRNLLPDVHQDCFADPHGQAFLWRDIESQGHMFIDYELHNYDKAAPNSLDAVTTRTIDWAILSERPYTRREFGNLLSGRALAPMCQTLCYFATDLGGLRGVATLLTAQIFLQPASDLPTHCLPRLLIVVDTTSRAFDPNAIRLAIIDAIAQSLPARDGDGDVKEKDCASSDDIESRIQLHFREIQVIGLLRSMSPAEQALQLQARLSTMNRESMAARKLHGFCFNRDHFFTMLGRLLDHFLVSWTLPFSFVEVSRPADFTLDELPHHLQEILSILPAEVWMSYVLCPLLASAIQLANYPPGSHHFPLNDIYERLYRPICRRAFGQAFVQPVVRDGLERALVKQLETLSQSRSTEPVAVQHAAQLTELQPYLSKIYSDKTCLSCLHRTPEKVLSCKHSLCNVCIRIYGQKSLTGKYCYVLENCPLCSEGHIGQSFRQIPPTAGIRLLTLDGGGARSIIQLIFLDRFQQRLQKLQLLITDVFDFVCGTSGGGLVVIGLFLMQWTTGESIQKFEQLAESTFGAKTHLTFSRLQQLVLSYLRDCRYNSQAIEDAFGGNAKMFNPLASDVRVAVTTTTAKNPRTCLLTNYNGGIRPPTTGYDVIRASYPESDVEISDAASCTSAAPWYFRPKTITKLGTFQDGGLQHNNPLSIALWELRFMWPARASPDFALSIGTGSSELTISTSKPGFISPVRDRFPIRLFRTFMTSLDGEKIWHDFRNNLPEIQRQRFHRMNLPIQGLEPAIDDVAGMHRLKNQAVHHTWTPQQLDRVMDSIYASMFYFEFEEEPIAREGLYHCTGNVFLRVHLSFEGRRELLKELLRTKSYFIVLGHPVKCVENVPRIVPLFKRRISFELGSLDEAVGITLRGITSAPTTISGLPKSAKDLLLLQRLRAPFGTADHAVVQKALPRVPLKRKHGDAL